MGRDERGFTIVELLVVMLLFSVLSTAFYQVLFSATAGSNTASDIARVSEEARLGFNRMVRDTREADRVTGVSATSFTVEIDFDGDGVIEPAPSPSAILGNYETLTYTFNPTSSTISVTSGIASETLVSGVSCVLRSNGTCEDVFSYASSRLEYDTNVDGVTSAAEIDAAPTIGNNNLSVWTLAEMGAIDRVTFSIKVTQGGSQADFHADAQLRNRR